MRYIHVYACINQSIETIPGPQAGIQSTILVRLVNAILVLLFLICLYRMRPLLRTWYYYLKGTW